MDGYMNDMSTRSFTLWAKMANSETYDEVLGARFSSIGEGWRAQGSQFYKTATVYRKQRRRLSASFIRAIIEKMFAESGYHFYIGRDEEVKPMSAARSRARQCEICTGKPERGKKYCAECARLSEDARRIVAQANPTLVVRVDDRWRWISGYIELVME